MKAYWQHIQANGAAGRWILALFAVAGVLLVWRWVLAFFWMDQANCGILAQAVLDGRWPIFVYGVHYMGALDGYIAAPLLAMTGPSSMAWNFWPVFYYLLTMLAMYKSLRLVSTQAGVLVGLLYLAIPPAELIFHAGQALTHYSLCLFIGALLVWLSLVMWRAVRWPTWQTFLWGLLAGLGYWANTQTAVIIVPCGLFLALFRLRQVRMGNLLSGAVGLLLGAGPMIYYKLMYGALDQPRANKMFSLDYIANNWPLWAKNAMPQVLGLNLGTEQKDLHSPWFWAYLAFAALTMACMLVMLWRALEKDQRFGLMLWGVALCNVGVLLISWFGQNLQWVDFRYLLPLYLVLPFAWASMADAAKAKWVPLAIACLLVVVHLGGYAAYRGGFVLDQGGFFFTEEPKFRKAIDTLRSAGVKGVYVHQSRVWSFLAAGKPQFCQSPNERRLFAVSQVDAMDSPAFMMPIAHELAFAGVNYRKLDVPKNIRFHVMGPAFFDIKLPYSGRRLLDRSRWSAEFSPAVKMFDGDLASGVGADSSPVVVDLGGVHKICAVALLSANFVQTPQAVRLELLDDQGMPVLSRQWRSPLGPLYWSGPHLFNKDRYPRLEAHFAPLMVRFVRISGIGGRSGDLAATVNELLVWEPEGPIVQPGWADSASLLMAHMSANGVKRVYGDAWISAYLNQNAPGKYWTLMANRSTDEFGHAVPPPIQPVLIAPRPGSALAVETGQARQTAQALRRWGCAFRVVPAGRLCLFLLEGVKYGQAITIQKVSATVNPEAAASLAGGSAAKWTSQMPQKPGIGLMLDLGKERDIGWLTLYNQDFLMDYPRKLRFEVSADDQTWSPVSAELIGPMVMAGPMVTAGKSMQSQYKFASNTKGRFLRIVLDAADPKFHWTVQKLELWTSAD